MNFKLRSQLLLTTVFCFFMLLFLFQTSKINNNNNKSDYHSRTFHPNAVLNYLKFKKIVDEVIEENDRARIRKKELSSSSIEAKE